MCSKSIMSESARLPGALSFTIPAHWAPVCCRTISRRVRSSTSISISAGKTAKFAQDIAVPLKPFQGTLGVAPPNGFFRPLRPGVTSSVPPGPHADNTDLSEMSELPGRLLCPQPPDLAPHAGLRTGQPLPEATQLESQALRVDQTGQRHLRQTRPDACILCLSRCTSQSRAADSRSRTPACRVLSRA